MPTRTLTPRLAQGCALLAGAALALVGACASRPPSGAPAPPDRRADAPAFAQAGLGPPPVQDAGAPEAPPELSCTWQTPLEPGIPGSPGHPIPSAINPNGDSELAALMRGMTADLRAAREALAQGEVLPSPSASHDRMPCVWPTDPSTRSALFDGLARHYEAAWNDLQRAGEGEPARAAYARVVSACKGCHQEYCQGPISMIESLALP